MKGDPQIIGPANYIPGYYHLFSKDYIIFVELIVKPKKHISCWNIRLERSGTPSLKFGTDFLPYIQVSVSQFGGNL